MISIFRKLFAPRGTGYLLTFLITSFSLVIFELVFNIIQGYTGLDQFWPIALLGFSLGIPGIFGLGGELFYLAVYAALCFLPAGQMLSFPTIGVYIIAIIWIIQGWFWQVSCLLAITIALGIISDINILPRLLGEIISIVAVIGIDAALRGLVFKIHYIETELDKSKAESKRAVTSIQLELARQLHDTIAKDLARIAISVESLSLRHPELNAEIRPIAKMSRSASQRIRPMIMNLNQLAKPPNLEKSIKDCLAMLKTRDLTLIVEVDTHVESKLDRQAALTTSLFVHETATNALKYAKSGTDVNLFIEQNGDNISIMMVNAIATEKFLPQLTGGYGLMNLQAKIQEEGGQLTFTKDSDRWIISATIPIQKEKNNE